MKGRGSGLIEICLFHVDLDEILVETLIGFFVSDRIGVGMRSLCMFFLSLPYLIFILLLVIRNDNIPVK